MYWSWSNTFNKCFGVLSAGDQLVVTVFTIFRSLIKFVSNLIDTDWHITNSY